MRISAKLFSFSLLGAFIPLLTGCRDNSPPVPHVPPPAQGYDTVERRVEPNKPLPPTDLDPTMAPRPFDDPPLLNDQPPETRRFVEVYKQVGRPRIVVFVNRTVTGEVLATASSRDLPTSRIDFSLVESLLADWLSAENQVTIQSPLTVRRTLTDQQVQQMEAGKAPLNDIARQLDADVLIQLQAQPTRQTPYGMEMRMVADAINLRGGESLARATVDMVPPLDKPNTNKYTRYLARKLMADMTNTWSTPADAKP